MTKMITAPVALVAVATAVDVFAPNGLTPSLTFVLALVAMLQVIKPLCVKAPAPAANPDLGAHLAHLDAQVAKQGAEILAQGKTTQEGVALVQQALSQIFQRFNI